MIRVFAALACLLTLLAGCGQPLRLDATRETRTPLIMATDAPPATVAGDATSEVISASTVEAATHESPQGPAPEPTPTDLPTVAPAEPATPTPAVQIIPQTAIPLTSEERWRQLQLEREVFDPPRTYRAVRLVTLYWYDPVVGQVLEVGTLSGQFPVQARFRLRSTGEIALETPYRINNDFGLTAISEAVRQRMAAAGYTVSVEAFIVESDAIQAPE